MLKIATTSKSSKSKFAQHDELLSVLNQSLAGASVEGADPSLAEDIQSLISGVEEGRSLTDSEKVTLTDTIDDLELPEDEFDRVASQAELVGGFEDGELGGSGLAGAGGGGGGEGTQRSTAEGGLVDFLDTLQGDMEIEGQDTSSVSSILETIQGGGVLSPGQNSELNNIVETQIENGFLDSDDPLMDEVQAANNASISAADDGDEPGAEDEAGDVSDDPDLPTPDQINAAADTLEEGGATADADKLRGIASKIESGEPIDNNDLSTLEGAGAEIGGSDGVSDGPPGPPPRPGLVWNPSTSRWVNPNKLSQRRLDRLMVRKFATLETRTVEGVEIFSSGTWTDSRGMQKDWTHADLDHMVNSAGELGGIALKTGHTSDEFNTAVAKAIGVPIELITGEGGGGQIALGTVSNVRRDGDKLVGDFTNVPSIIADLIEGGQFRSVSSEIEMNEDMVPSLAGVALLGAEAPAVDNLAPLYEAAVFKANANKSRSWVSFSLVDVNLSAAELEADFTDLETKVEDTIRGKKGSRTLRALWSSMREKFKEIKAAKLKTEERRKAREARNKLKSKSKSSKSNNVLPPNPVQAANPNNQSSSDGRPPKSWWDRAIQAAKAFGIEDPSRFAGSVWFNNEPFTRESFDSPEAAIGAAVKMSEVIPAWLSAQAEAGGAQRLDHHTAAERLRGVKWLATDLGLPENSPVEQVIAKLTELMNSPDNTTEEEELLMGSKAVKSLADFQVAVEDLPRIYEALGLTDEATIEDVLAAIQGLGGGEGEGEGEGNPMDLEGGGLLSKDKTKSTSTNPEIKALQEKQDKSDQYIAVLEHKEKVNKYLEYTRTWDGIEGTPEELAEELAVVEETFGTERATSLVQSYSRAQKTAVESGMLFSQGHGSRLQTVDADDDEDNNDDNLDPYEAQVKKYAEDNKVTHQVALARVSSANPEKFQEYRIRLAEHQEAKLAGSSNGRS